VVASEVRALAQRSADAAKEIKGLIQASERHVGNGVNHVSETGKALSVIVEQVSRINSLITDMAGSAQEQASALGEVNIAVNHMDQMTQQNAAMVEETTAAAHTMRSNANELSAQIGGFRTTSMGPVSRKSGGQASHHAETRSEPRAAAARTMAPGPQGRRGRLGRILAPDLNNPGQERDQAGAFGPRLFLCLARRRAPLN